MVSTNTNAAAIMIGEKGAALVREDAARSHRRRARRRGGRGVILDNAQVPLYVQLADLFRQRIVKGVWKEGEKLPSLEQLVDEFEVARVTVRQAIERLTRDGLVSPQRGRGTFVTGAPRSDRWLRVETSLRSLADVYRDTHPTILNIDEVDAQPAPDRRARRRAGAEQYVYMRRVHSHQGRPYCVIDIYLDAAIFARHPARFRKETVIPLLMAMPSVKIVDRAPGADDLDRRPRGRAPSPGQRQRAGRRRPARLHRAEAARHLPRRGHLPRRLRARRVRPQGVITGAARRCR